MTVKQPLIFIELEYFELQFCYKNKKLMKGLRKMPIHSLFIDVI